MLDRERVHLPGGRQDHLVVPLRERTQVELDARLSARRDRNLPVGRLLHELLIPGLYGEAQLQLSLGVRVVARLEAESQGLVRREDEAGFRHLGFQVNVLFFRHRSPELDLIKAGAASGGAQADGAGIHRQVAVLAGRYPVHEDPHDWPGADDLQSMVSISQIEARLIGTGYSLPVAGQNNQYPRPPPEDHLTPFAEGDPQVHEAELVLPQQDLEREVSQFLILDQDLVELCEAALRAQFEDEILPLLLHFHVLGLHFPAGQRAVLKVVGENALLQLLDPATGCANQQADREADGKRECHSPSHAAHWLPPLEYV